MAKEDIDVQAVRADFMQKREAKLEKERQVEVRDELETRAANPPAVRGTDGLPPGTKEQNPLEIAAKADAETDTDEDADDGVPTAASTVADIKAYLDEQGVDYEGVTKKTDLLALISAE